jgi:hypothetical protein
LVRKGDVNAAALEALLRKAFGSLDPVSWDANARRRLDPGVSGCPVWRERRIQPLPQGYAESIRGSAVLLGLRQLCRWLAPERGLGLDHPVIVARAKRITQILDPRLFQGYGAFKRD